MSGRKIDEKIVSIPEVMQIMENVKEKVELVDTEEGMSHFQEITYNYVHQFGKMNVKDARKIKKFLIDKYELEELFVINIINIDPQNVQEIRIILEKSPKGKTLDDEQLQELLYQIQELKTL